VRPLPRAVLAALGAALAVLASVGAGPAHATATDAQARRTTITFAVTGCEGCTLTASQFDRSTKRVFGSKGAVVADSRAVLVVPTARTRGMYFAILTPRPARIDAQPLVTTQVAGHAPGSVVTKGQQKAGRRASACWAGTSEPAVTLSVVVDRVLMPAFPDSSRAASVPLARFVPTVAALGGFQRAFRGVLATQDVWLCAN